MPPPPIQAWIQAARPKTLAAGVAPVCIGTVLAAADGGFHAGAAVLALAGALLIQIGTNFWNDVADFVRGTDRPDRVGPPRAVAMGWISPSAMRRTAHATFALAALCSLGLAVRAGWPVAALGVLAIALGYAYTSGPAPLAYLGLADWFVLVFFGPVAVAGTYYVQTLELTPQSLVAGLAPGLLSSAILVANNLRDRDSDARASKRTLTVRFGLRFGQVQYTVFLFGGLALPAILAGLDGRYLAKFSLLALLPFAFFPLRTVWIRPEPRALLPVLGRTAALLAAMTVILCLTWMAGSPP